MNISANLIDRTLKHLQDAGKENCECVVLWLGRRRGEVIEVEEIFLPEQYAEEDYFRIPRAGMSALLAYLRQNRLFIAAQVHSHPERAFHSKTDDFWAIIRHVGAFSLVVPYFALRTNYQSFLADTVTYQLSPDNEWLEVAKHEVRNRFSITL